MRSDDDLLVQVEHVLAASPARVFHAFADTRLLPRWLTPSPEIAMRVETLDFRVGGAYRFVYTLPDHSEVGIGGVYRTIQPPERLVFSWIIDPPDEHSGIESEVTVTIEPAGQGSRLRIRHLGWPIAPAARRHEGGWVGALDQLATILEVP
jgi:uncharacterized protein YndB with AHSA1/START domain